MNEGMGYLLAIALTIAVFLVLMYVFQERHFLLKYLFIMAIMLAGYFIPTAVINLKTTCETVVANSTDVTDYVTSYEYTSFCYTTETNTADTFYQVYDWVYFIMILYFVVKIFYELYQSQFGGRKFNVGGMK